MSMPGSWSLRVLIAAALLAAAAPAASADPGCGGEVACRVEGGAYRVAVPPGWDGRTPLPAMVFLHGFGGSGADALAHLGLAEAAARRGVLVAAPDGEPGGAAAGDRRGWSFPGSPRRGRDDAAFLAAVGEDLSRRFPVDRARLVAAGFSVGGSMVWDLACRAPGPYAAFAPVAGAFWEPLPDGCAAPARPLVHVHGTADGVVPLAGRPIGGGRWRQGDVEAGVRVLLRQHGCEPAPDRVEASPGGVCRVWDAGSCASGAGLLDCRHPGGHDVPEGWFDRTVDWVLSLPR
jgi:polyhydroxybutyrate depolymerase